MRRWLLRAGLGLLVLFLLACIGFLVPLDFAFALVFGWDPLPVAGRAPGPHQLVGPGDGHRLPGAPGGRLSPLPRLVLQATGWCQGGARPSLAMAMDRLADHRGRADVRRGTGRRGRRSPGRLADQLSAGPRGRPWRRTHSRPASAVREQSQANLAGSRELPPDIRRIPSRHDLRRNRPPAP